MLAILALLVGLLLPPALGLGAAAAGGGISQAYCGAPAKDFGDPVKSPSLLSHCTFCLTTQAGAVDEVVVARRGTALPLRLGAEARRVVTPARVAVQARDPPTPG